MFERREWDGVWCAHLHPFENLLVKLTYRVLYSFDLGGGVLAVSVEGGF